MKLFIVILGFICMQSTGWSAKQAIEVQGHRGARAHLPENSIPAFEYALKTGVDVLELDLGITKDKRIVVNHDLAVNPDICQYDDGTRLTAPVLINSLTLAEIKKFDCGAIKNVRFPDQKTIPHTKIPTLDEVFKLAAQSKSPSGRPVEFNIETKIEPERPGDTVTPEEFASLVVKKIQEFKMMSRVTIQSFDYRTLREARRLHAKVKIAALSENKDEDLLKTAQELKADIISPFWEMLDKNKVSALQKAGIRVIPWTANKSDQWEKLIDMGVDGIITDDPESLVSFLKKQGLR